MCLRFEVARIAVVFSITIHPQDLWDTNLCSQAESISSNPPIADHEEML